MDDLPELLTAHLRTWLGHWPPGGSLTVTTAPGRTEPGWDGAVHAVVGVATPESAVLSVPPDRVDAVRDLAPDLVSLRRAGARLGDALGRPGARLFEGVFRWSDSPAAMPDAGEWVPHDDPRVPDWLRPFGGDVLVAWGDDGRYIAGVGIKLHDRYGQELSVVTEPEAQGKGLARRLVAQAARRIVERGAVATYLHADTNHASARVAEACGFPDRGWRVLGIAG